MAKTPAKVTADAGSAKASAGAPKHAKQDTADGKLHRKKHKPNFKERRKLKALKLAGSAGGSKSPAPASAATPGKGKKPNDAKSAKEVTETKVEPNAVPAKVAASPVALAQKKATPKKPQTPASSRRPRA